MYIAMKSIPKNFMNSYVLPFNTIDSKIDRCGQANYPKCTSQYWTPTAKSY